MSEKKYSILYVDDEEINTRSLYSLYRRHYHVFLADTGAEGLKILEKEKIDLIISDQRMPEMTGVEFFMEAKKKWPDIPTILLTGFTDYDVIKDAINKVGIYSFVNKPFDQDDLKLSIDRALESYKLKKDLEISEEKFKGVFESMEDIFLRINTDGIVKMVSPSMERVFGQKIDEIIEKPALDYYVDPKKREELTQLIQQKGKVTNFIIDLKTMQGDIISASLNSKFYKDKEGNVLGIESVLRDVTEQVKIENKIVELKNRYQNLFEDSPDAIFIHSQGIITHVNDAFLRLYGYTNKEEIIGKSGVTALVVEEDRPICLNDIKKINDKDKLVISNYRHQKKDGFEFIAEVYTAKMVGEGVDHFQIIVRDITERVELQNQIKANNQLLNEAQKIADLGYIQWDIINDEMVWSELIYKLSGFDGKRDLNFETTMTICHPDDIQRVRESLDTALLSKDPFDVESRIVNVQTKEIAWVNIRANVYFDNDANPENLVASVLDITQKKQAENEIKMLNENLELRVEERTAQLEKSQKKLAKSLEKEKEIGELKSRFVATASHQFRTPLTVIQSNIGLLAMQFESLEGDKKMKFDKVHHRISGQIGRMTDLMNEVLVLGKIQSGSISTVFKPTDIVELCNDLVGNYNEIQEDGRIIEIKVSGEPKLVNLDQKLIEQAISNILSNALKYSSGKPAPEFKIKFNEKKVELLIKDFGIGIPKKDMEHIFDPFHRASNVSDFSGTGLGTAIAKEYIEINKGKISLVSELDKGSECLITFKN